VDEGRWVAPGGWQRAAVGFALGVAAGAAAGLLLPRDEGPRRRRDLHERPEPFDTSDMVDQLGG
jgi:hypothetical protein